MLNINGRKKYKRKWRHIEKFVFAMTFDVYVVGIFLLIFLSANHITVEFVCQVISIFWPFLKKWQIVIIHIPTTTNYSYRCAKFAHEWKGIDEYIDWHNQWKRNYVYWKVPKNEENEGEEERKNLVKNSEWKIDSK